MGKYTILRIQEFSGNLPIILGKGRIFARIRKKKQIHTPKAVSLDSSKPKQLWRVCQSGKKEII